MQMVIRYCWRQQVFERSIRVSTESVKIDIALLFPSGKIIKSERTRAQLYPPQARQKESLDTPTHSSLKKKIMTMTL